MLTWNIVSGEHLVDETWRWLAVRGRFARQLGRHTDRREQVIAKVDEFDHPPIDGLDLGHAEKPPSHTRLVREEETFNGRGLEPGKSLACAGADTHVLGIAKIVNVVDERAVTIKEHRPNGAFCGHAQFRLLNPPFSIIMQAMADDLESKRAIEAQHREHAEVMAAMAAHHDRLLAIADRLTECLRGGGTLYLCGNGGSAADAQHVAAEFVGRFLRERRPLPAIALTCNTSALTAIGNDYDFSEIFARQVRAHVTARDCVIGISTSGRSSNVLKALAAAREIGATTIGFTGSAGRELTALCAECFMAPSTSTPRIQEAHLLAWHLVCDEVERQTVASEGR